MEIGVSTRNKRGNYSLYREGYFIEENKRPWVWENGNVPVVKTLTKKKGGRR